MEIKFRDKDLENDEVRYFTIDQYDRENHDCYGNIQQYIGRKDKTGRDIYEGDVLEYQVKGGMYLNTGMVEYDCEISAYVIKCENNIQHLIPMIDECIIFRVV